MKYYIIAGEASGDLHGSNLLRGLYEEDPQVQLRFWGGDAMLAVFREHCTDDPSQGLVKHYGEGAVMGITDVLSKAGKLLDNLELCKEDICSWQPDAVILIDYPGFNFRIAEFAHKKGFKVFYYIAPKTWASREGRNRKLKKYVDKLFIVFPFEIPYFTEKGIDFIYKGNPLVDAIDNAELHRVTDAPHIAMLAGSRKGEVSRMMPVLTGAAKLLHETPGYEAYHFVFAGAPGRSVEDYKEWLTGMEDYTDLVFGRTYDALKFADAAVINSGTASLEAVLLGTPQLVGWNTSFITAALCRLFKIQERIKYISLGNLIIGKFAFKEQVQEEFTSESAAAELRKLIEDKDYRNAMLSDYALIREKLGGAGASRAVAEAMIEELKK